MSDDIVVLLKLQAKEIKQEWQLHNFTVVHSDIWSDTMLLAAKEIQILRDQFRLLQNDLFIALNDR